MAKALYQLEGKLSGELLDAISSEASTTSIRCRFFDSDSKTTARVPDAATLLFAIDPENTQAKTTEWILATSHATVNGVTTLSNVTRGLQRDETIDLTGSAARANDWDAGTPIGVNTIPFNDNLMKAYFEGTEPIPNDMEFDGDVDFDGDVRFNQSVRDPVYADAAARDAAITSPTNGMSVYNTAAGEFQDYTGGAWVGRAAGSTPNASTTVAGKVEEATQAEFDSGTDVGGTGARLFAVPSVIQSLLPSGVITPYAGSTAPTNWLLCDGTTGLDSVADTTLAPLFAVIGTTFGGTGANDFALPDLRGNFILGLDNMGGTSRNRVTDAAADTIGGEGGAQTHTLTVSEIPSHSHDLLGNNLNDGIEDFGAGNIFGRRASGLNQYMRTVAANVNNTTAIDNEGGGGAHENMSPYMAMNYIIKK